MAIELITGRAGTPHVDSADVGAMNAALFGSDVYILSGASAELVDANNVRISAGELLAEGRHFRITGSGETLAISNGLSGYNRNDIIAAKYLRDGNGIETVSLVVIKGSNASGTPADPAMPTSGKLIDGASEVYWPLYRITVNALTPQAPEMVAHGWAAYVGADSIIAEGTSGSWRYWKWSNGLAICNYEGNVWIPAIAAGATNYSYATLAGMPFTMSRATGAVSCDDRLMRFETYSANATVYITASRVNGSSLTATNKLCKVTYIGFWK